MMTVQLYRNPVHYPDYKRSIAAAGSPMPAKPVRLQTRSGTISISASFDSVFNVNYLRLQNGNSVLWAWITEVRSGGRENTWELDYDVDPLRTYLSRIDWGFQFVLRDNTANDLLDPLLGSTQAVLNYQNTKIVFNGSGNEFKRVFVVQVRKTSGNTAPSSSVPTQYIGYYFFLLEYDLRTPDDSALGLFVNGLTGQAPYPGIITAYSAPWFNISKFPLVENVSGLPSIKGITDQGLLGTWRIIGDQSNSLLPSDIVSTHYVAPPTLPTYYKRVPHHARVIIPGAGIMPVSDYMLQYGFTIRRDMDIYTGACNYMLQRVGGDGAGPDGSSVRSSAIPSIPIIGDPKDVYLSQNQNALSTAMMGDVAMIGGGILGTFFGMPGGVNQVMNGLAGIGERNTRIKDLENLSTSPPAMFAPALVHNFNDVMYLEISYKKCDNEDLVHQEAGYPQNMFKLVTIPATGFIQTQNCSVKSDGYVPQWAIEAINRQMDDGIEFSA